MLWFQAPLAPPPPIHHPSDLLNLFRMAEQSWIPGIRKAALDLLFLIGTIDVAWAMKNALEEDANLQRLVAVMSKRILQIGFWFTAALYGVQWFHSVIDTFVQVGAEISGFHLTGLNAITPSSLFADCFNILGQLADAAKNLGWLDKFFIGNMLGMVSVFILAAYIIIVLHLIVSVMYAQISVALGYIFTGFGGSTWTLPYAERYVTMVISSGFRLLVLYVCLSVSHTLAHDWWLPGVQAITTHTDALLLCLELAGEVFLYALLCWLVPHFAASVLSGAADISGHHLVAFAAPVLQSTIAGTSMVVSAISGGTAAPVQAAAQGASAAANSVTGAASNGTGGVTPSSPPPQPVAPSSNGHGSAAPPQPFPSKR